jgi:hypothetical protein
MDKNLTRLRPEPEAIQGYAKASEIIHSGRRQINQRLFWRKREGFQSCEDTQVAELRI